MARGGRRVGRLGFAFCPAPCNDEAIVGGRSTVRAALYMAAFNAIRCNPQIREFYRRLRQAGKCYKVAITACMRKLLTVPNAMVRDNTPWRKPAMTT